MNWTDAKYAQGADDALQAFGVRTAAFGQTHQRMPEGPMHLGAERLARALTAEGEKENWAHGNGKMPSRLERNTRWGPKVSLENSSQIAQAPTGLGHYAGV
jgi:hypothetical protein